MNGRTFGRNFLNADVDVGILAMDRSGDVNPIELNEESELPKSEELQFFQLRSAPERNRSGVQELQKVSGRFNLRLGKEDRHLVRVDVLEGVKDSGHRRAELLEQKFVSSNGSVGADEDEVGVSLRGRCRAGPELTEQRLLPFFSAFPVA